MKFYRPIANIKALTFDLDDTLYDNYPVMRRAEKALRDYLAERFPAASQLSTHDWYTFKQHHLQRDPALASDMGELRRRTLRSALTKSGYDDQNLDDHVEDCFTYFYHHRSDFQVAPDIVRLLEELSKSVPLVAITNGNVNLQQIGVEHCFTESFHARIDQPMKPHQKMFELASAVLNISPASILHVGDNLEKDIMGARQAGFATAWYAVNRKMNMLTETVNVLPDMELKELAELRSLF